MSYKLNSTEKKEVIRIFNENGYDVTNKEELFFYLEGSGATYIADKRDVVDQFAEVMEIRCPIDFLDWDKITDEDDDWEELSENRFLNIERIFNDLWVLDELELRKECIKQQ